MALTFLVDGLQAPLGFGEANFCAPVQRWHHLVFNVHTLACSWMVEVMSHKNCSAHSNLAGVPCLGADLLSSKALLQELFLRVVVCNLLLCSRRQEPAESSEGSESPSFSDP